MTNPESVQFFSDNGTIEVARSISSDWTFFQTILSKDDPTGGAKGIHVPLIFSPSQSIRFRLCFSAFLNVVESLRLCNGIIRGDSSALIAAHGEFCSVLVTLRHILYPGRKVSTLTDSIVMAFDVDAHPATPSKLSLPSVLKSLLDDQLPSQENPQRQMFLNKYTAFLSSLVIEIQGILWGGFNGGLRHFSIFSLPVIKIVSFESVKEKFAALISFMKKEKLLITSMVSKWEDELVPFYRDVITPLDLTILSDSDILTYWIDSGSLAAFPNLHHLWIVICCLSFDVTDSHSFEEESFKPQVCVTIEDFQMGVEIVRLYHHSWRDRSMDSQGVWTIPPEVKLRIDQVSDIVQARKRDFSDRYSRIQSFRKRMNLVRLQLGVISSLSAQGVT